MDDSNKLERVDWAKEAELFAQHIQRTAVELLPKKANPLDIALFKQGMKILHESFDELADVLNASKSNRTNEAYMHLRGLLAAAFVLGQSAVMSPKMKKMWLSEDRAAPGKKSGKVRAEMGKIDEVTEGDILDPRPTKQDLVRAKALFEKSGAVSGAPNTNAEVA